MKKNRLNDEINNLEIRLIDENGNNKGVVNTQEAQNLADEKNLDLVELVPNEDPPVCKIMDYGKFKFIRSKKAQQSKKKQKRTQVKEIKFRPGTEEGDYQIKLRNLIKFLLDGDKTKVSLRFRGREIIHKDRGLSMLERIERDLKDFAIVEQKPKAEGRILVMVFAPKR